MDIFWNYTIEVDRLIECLPKCSIKYGRPIKGLLAHTKPLLLLYYVHHVFDELLKETGHGAHIIVSKYPEMTHCNKLQMYVAT